jgi:hypothetical protein
VQTEKTPEKGQAYPENLLLKHRKIAAGTRKNIRYEFRIVN